MAKSKAELLDPSTLEQRAVSFVEKAVWIPKMGWYQVFEVPLFASRRGWYLDQGAATWETFRDPPTIEMPRLFKSTYYGELYGAIYDAVIGKNDPPHGTIGFIERAMKSLRGGCTPPKLRLKVPKTRWGDHLLTGALIDLVERDPLGPWPSLWTEQEERPIKHEGISH